MRIDGKSLAETILTNLGNQIKEFHLTPTLTVILVGDKEESVAYIMQKQKAVERLGGKFILEKLPATTTQKELSARVSMYNADPSVHGLIVQRPLPPELTATGVLPKKDIDGFSPDSPFTTPIVAAVFLILEQLHVDLQTKKIVVLGRGETAGQPIADAFKKKECATSIIHSKTTHPENIIRSADIVISCVGKVGVVPAASVKPGAILLSVGLFKGQDGKWHGDYDEDKIKDIAGAYTPTPGGIGPVNIACLMQNLVKACMMK